MIFICDKCKETFNKRALWLRHCARKTSCIIQCPYCPMTFEHKEILAYHVNHKVCRKYSVYYCHGCGLTYKNKKHYDRHREKYHTEDPVYIEGPLMSDFFA